jgi:hypothetical protein
VGVLYEEKSMLCDAVGWNGGIRSSTTLLFSLHLGFISFHFVYIVPSNSRTMFITWQDRGMYFRDDGMCHIVKLP